MKKTWLGHSLLVVARSHMRATKQQTVPLNATAMVSRATFARAQECPQRSPLSPYGPCKPGQAVLGAAATGD